MPSRLLYHKKKALQTLLPVGRSREKNEGNQQWLTHTQLRQEASHPGLPLVASSSTEEGCTDTNAYWGRLHRYQCLLGKAAQTPMLTGEGCTDTNAYWGRLYRHQCLLGKAAQTPMLTGEGCTDTNTYWGKLHRHQYLLGKAAQTPMLTGKGCTDTNAYWGRMHRH